jgi:uncharacterized Ntn-hydrolase superfamily protein
VTFSVLARDPLTGDIGVATQSKFLAVGAVVPSAAAEVGAIATQALANGSFGPRGLALLAAGSDAEQTLAELIATDDRPDRRQVGILDAKGRGAAHTGTARTGWAGHIVGEDFVCVGNMLVGAAVLQSMADSLTATSTEPSLAIRLVTALNLGADAGGDARGQQSAAVIVCRDKGGYGGHTDRWIDLRVDDHLQPIAELRRLIDLHSLYFERPPVDSLLELKGDLAIEVISALNRVNVPVASAHPEALWEGLDQWSGRENLEERMIRAGWIDPVVLDVLRRQARSDV